MRIRRDGRTGDRRFRSSNPATELEMEKEDDDESTWHWGNLPPLPPLSASLVIFQVTSVIFCPVRSNLSVAGRLLVYDRRIVIPNTLKLKILEIIHYGHQRITKCNERVKSAVWWFGIGKNIKSVVSRC